ncbi:MAG: M48 family metalloprotease [Vicinamibacterales bacterium]
MNEDKSTRYHRLKRRFTLLGLAWRALLLSGMLWTGLSTALRDAATTTSAIVAPQVAPGVGVVLYMLVLLLLNELGSWPLAYYGGFELEDRYGLSEQSYRSWMTDQLKSIALGGALSIGGALLLYAMIAISPGAWWLTAGIAFAIVAAALTRVGPVLLLPLFYAVKPLERESLRARLVALADRAGASVVGAYEWSVSGKTRKANAALAGLGATRRIFVSDTMLASYSDDEVEVVLAHELGHHVHGDIWKGLAIQTGIILLGFAAGDLVLSAVGSRLGVTAPGDVAGLPAILLAFGAVSGVSMPLQFAFMRLCERRADRFALTLTRNPDAFISAMRRLGAQNLAEPKPSRLVQWLFYSHPPIDERISSARSFRPGAPGRAIPAGAR